MRKVLSIAMAITLIFSMTFTVVAAEKSTERGKSSEKSYSQNKGKDSLQKSFKKELNDQKKLIIQEKAQLEREAEQLQLLYEELVLAGDTAGSDNALAMLEEINDKISALKNDMKQVMNERFMVTKTLYTEEELAQFENAAMLIDQMYKDAYTLSLGSIMIKDNIIKFDSPPYIKGGRTVIPVRAIMEELGASVSYDQETGSVTVSKDGIDIVFTINSKTVYVDGVIKELDAEAEITNQRTYVPLRFIAETFGLDVSYDEETETIDIEEPEVDDPEVEEPDADEPEQIIDGE